MWKTYQQRVWITCLSSSQFLIKINEVEIPFFASSDATIYRNFGGYTAILVHILKELSTFSGDLSTFCAFFLSLTRHAFRRASSNITACFVDNMENLSTKIVDNSGLLAVMWIMWKTYPHSLWKTRRACRHCGKCGKLIHTECV